jgi:hypothetical protein
MKRHAGGERLVVWWDTETCAELGGGQVREPVLAGEADGSFEDFVHPPLMCFDRVPNESGLIGCDIA